MKTKSKLWLVTVLLLLLATRSHGQTTNIRGLVVIVNFSDYQLNATEAQVNNLMNSTSGFNLWGNTTSVREYFRIQSANKVDLTNEIISVTLPQNSSYYVGNNTSQDFTEAVVNAINVKYPNGFTGLSIHPTNNWIWNFSMISRTPNGGGVAWHAPNLYIKNNGVNTLVKHVSHSYYGGSGPITANTICHEYGHSVFNWGDYYHTASSNLGFYCLMGSGGSNAAPMPISPFFRLKAGWIDNVVNITSIEAFSLYSMVTLTANSYTTIHKYTNPSNPKEYLLFHAVKHDRYYQSTLENNYPVPEGLAIYYVDEDDGFGVPGVSDRATVKLVQADNKDQMHDESAEHINKRGDIHDLYGNGNNSFPNNHPIRWKDGGEVGINLVAITRSGNNVTFSVLRNLNTVIATSDENGSIHPSGVIGGSLNGAPNFAFNPKPGYEINTVTVDGKPVAVKSNMHGLRTTGINRIHVTFKRKTTTIVLPYPWQQADIGSASTSGFSSHADGTFYLESYGNDIWGHNDNFRFVYQTIEGNGSIEGRLNESNKPNNWTKTGLMIRGSLQPNSAHGMLIFTPSNLTRIQYRSSNGSASNDGPMQLDDLHHYQLYKWYRITRQGNTLTFFISKDRANWAQIGQQTITLPQQIFLGMIVSGANGNYPVRASFDNVTVSQNNIVPCMSGTKIISNNIIGTTGSWGNSGNTRDKAFDGNADSFFDAPISNQAWTGLSLTTPHRVTGIRYHPRKGHTRRMVGGKFQGSNNPNFTSGVVDLATVVTEPAAGWNCLPVTNSGSFQYLRYVGPNGSNGTIAEIEFYGEQNPACAISGTILGGLINSFAYFNNSGNLPDKVFDGNITTFFDAASSNASVGLTLDIAHTITGIRFYPRASNAHRMVGGRFEGSHNSSFGNAVTLATITQQPSYGWNCVTVSNTTAFRYIRYVGPSGGYGNIAELEFYGTPDSNCGNIFGLLSGVSIGSNGSRNNSGNTRDKAFDGNITTFFDAATDIAWTGLALNNRYLIKNIRFQPRPGYTKAMIGGKFQASTTEDFSTQVVDLATITTEPQEGWNCIKIHNLPTYRYVRYVGPQNSYANVAEIEFYGSNPHPDGIPEIIISNIENNASFMAPTNLTINTAFNTNAGTPWKVEFYVNSQLIATDNTAPFSATTTTIDPGAHTLTIVAYSAYGTKTSSHSINITASGISGPACVNNNSAYTYELTPDKRVNAISYEWRYISHNSSQTIVANSGAPYQATLYTNSNYTVGIVCADVLYQHNPYSNATTSETYCRAIGKCPNSRDSNMEMIDLYVAETISYQNPFSTTTTISFGNPAETADIQVFNSAGMLMEEANATGAFQFGEKVGPGLYLLRINFYDRTEVIKLIKQ